MLNIIVLIILISCVIALFGLGIYLGMFLKDEQWKKNLLKDVKSSKSKKWIATIVIDVSEKEPVVTIATGSTKPAKGQGFIKGLSLSQSFFY